MVSLTFPPTKRCGSGKFGMPLERMHWEKASSPFCVVVVVAAVVEEATLATPGEPAAATAGREQRERGNRDDGGEDEWTAATHHVRFLSVGSKESSPPQPERDRRSRLRGC